jgi:hypothetical protein
MLEEHERRPASQVKKGEPVSFSCLVRCHCRVMEKAIVAIMVSKLHKAQKDHAKVSLTHTKIPTTPIQTLNLTLFKVAQKLVEQDARARNDMTQLWKEWKRNMHVRYK